MTALSIALVVSVAMLCGTRLAGRWLDRREMAAHKDAKGLADVQARVREISLWMDGCDAKLRELDEVKAALARKEVWK